MPLCTATGTLIPRDFRTYNTVRSFSYAECNKNFTRNFLHISLTLRDIVNLVAQWLLETRTTHCVPSVQETPLLHLLAKEVKILVSDFSTSHENSEIACTRSCGQRAERYHANVVVTTTLRIATFTCHSETFNSLTGNSKKSTPRQSYHSRSWSCRVPTQLSTGRNMQSELDLSLCTSNYPAEPLQRVVV